MWCAAAVASLGVIRHGGRCKDAMFKLMAVARHGYHSPIDHSASYGTWHAASPCMCICNAPHGRPSITMCCQARCRALIPYFGQPRGRLATLQVLQCVACTCGLWKRYDRVTHIRAVYMHVPKDALTRLVALGHLAAVRQSSNARGALNSKDCVLMCVMKVLHCAKTTSAIAAIPCIWCVFIY